MTDMDRPLKPNAKFRLQASREALMHQLMPATRVDARMVPGLSASDIASPVAPHETHMSNMTSSRSAVPSGVLSMARHSLKAWWEFHPARAVGAIAQTVLAEYAQRKPLKLVGIAAGVGATLLVVRPWRLVSVGGLAMAALKSSQVSNFALSLLMSRNKKGR